MGRKIIKFKNFKFGENWQDYSIKYLDKEKIIDAEKSLIKIFNKDLKGKRFLDIGCGSGLFSLAALNLGASKVTSFDIDQESVNCCRSLFFKYKCPQNWIINQGSVLDNKFIKNLGRFDIVYSYGVLHHTGQMYQAIKNSAGLVDKGGLLYLAIYNKKENFTIFPLESFGTSKFWEKEKRLFASLPKIFQTALTFFASLFIRKNFKERGMVWQTDLTDWLGGYPYEYASPGEIFSFVKKLRFSLEDLKTNSGLRNNEYLFRKTT